MEIDILNLVAKISPDAETYIKNAFARGSVEVRYFKKNEDAFVIVNEDDFTIMYVSLLNEGDDVLRLI